ncbi:MAG TPA: DUF4287 domain-containing protein [Caulobacteraceae bacterium]|jgi:hypothetical protein
MTEPHLTERQQKWFASVRAGLERDTGKSMAQWVEIARACPETAHRARLKWFKDVHGLAQNRASQVLGEAFDGGMGWDQPQALVDALWADPQARVVFEAVRAAAMALPETVMGPRKSYTAFSRQVQFCALKPVKAGVLLGLAVPPESDPRLTARGKSESWSERLAANLLLTAPSEVDSRTEALLRRAWEAC